MGATDYQKSGVEHSHFLAPSIKGITRLNEALSSLANTEMDFIVDPRLREISAWPCLVVA